MAASPSQTSLAPPTHVAPPERSGRVRRRYHFGYGGFLYVSVTLLIALGAFNSQNNLLYWTFGFALALLLVSGLISGAMLMGVRAEREWVSGAQAGELLRIRYRVRNINRVFPAFALTIEESGFDAPPPPGLLATIARVLGVGSTTPPPRSPIFDQPRCFIAHVGAGDAVHAEAIALARRRGPASFSAIVVHTSFPFGLLRKSLRIPQHGATVITPQPAGVDLEAARGASRDGPFGSASRRPGRGDEFFSLREYVHGDSPRDVAWRASAKRGSLLVRQFAAPAPHRVWIVLHLRTRPGADADDERAIRVAAGLARLAESRGTEYGLAVPLTRLLAHPRRGPGHLARLMTDLGLIDLGADDARGARCAFPPQAASAGARCVVVYSGAFDGAFAPAGDHVSHVIARAKDGGPVPSTPSPGPKRGLIAAA